MKYRVYNNIQSTMAGMIVYIHAATLHLLKMTKLIFKAKFHSYQTYYYLRMYYQITLDDSKLCIKWI